jgi:hypothetical protein
MALVDGDSLRKNVCVNATTILRSLMLELCNFLKTIDPTFAGPSIAMNKSNGI